MERLIAERFALYFIHVTLNLAGGSRQHYAPGEWLAKPPFNLEPRTIHVDRLRFDDELPKILIGHGVTSVQDKVVAVEKFGRRATE